MKIGAHIRQRLGETVHCNHASLVGNPSSDAIMSGLFVVDVLLSA